MTQRKRVAQNKSGQANQWQLVVAEDTACADYVTEQLREFNKQHSQQLAEAYKPENAPVPLHVFALNEAGELLGGLLGETRNHAGWLEIAILWVDETVRDRGLGTQLMQQAEAEAKQRGCRYARLSTFDFQARLFYEKLGYQVYGSLEDYPPGHTVYYLRKELV